MFTARDQPVLRCAVYTRQSVANAELDLTSCDVQRERCENYIRAMHYEGFVVACRPQPHGPQPAVVGALESPPRPGRIHPRHDR